MTTVEALRVSSIQHESTRVVRECGLINPFYMEQYVCGGLSYDELERFDTLSDMANHGLIQFNDREFRIDHRLESGNMIRSVVEVIETDQHGNALAKSSSHIAHTNGNSYFETHQCIIDTDGTIHEPEIGGPEIVQGEYTDMIIHGLIAYGATTLPEAA